MTLITNVRVFDKAGIVESLWASPKGSSYSACQHIAEDQGRKWQKINIYSSVFCTYMDSQKQAACVQAVSLSTVMSYMLCAWHRDTSSFSFLGALYSRGSSLQGGNRGKHGERERERQRERERERERECL